MPIYRISRGIILIVISVISAALIEPCFAQKTRSLREPVKIENYADAPLELRLLRSWVKEGSSDQWVETCIEYSIRNKTKKSFDSYSYDFGSGGEGAQIGGKVFVVPKPHESLINQACVSNSTSKNEGFFLFRLSFVESKAKTSWESKQHKKAFKDLSRELKNPVRVDSDK